MTDDFQMAPDRVDRIEQKLDRLITSTDTRFGEASRGFADVSEAIAEQRRYTEFAFERLDKKVTTIDAKLDEVLRLLRR